jgi:osmoprotectant transport system permease protein
MRAQLAQLLAADEPFVRWSWVEDHLDDIRADAIEHLQLTAMAVAIGFALSMGMALLATRWRWTYGVLAGFCAVLYAIPSLALFGILVPITGLGIVPAEIALVGYTLLILLRNIVAGIDGVPDHVREAADGMGYEPWRRVLRIDLPLALPAIIAGLRIATVTTVGLVTVASLVGKGGFGNLINDGLSRDFSTPVVVGTVLSVALAVVLDVIYVLIERFSTPWARQGRQRDTRIDPGTPSRAAAVVGAPATPGAAAIATAGDAVGRIARG